MRADLSGKSLLSLEDYNREEIRYFLNLARAEKKKKKGGGRFTGLSLAMLFEKPSTRTRCAFETAFGEEGGYPLFLSLQDVHLGSKETIEDTACVFGRMFDAILFRGFLQQTAISLARYSGLPVYNGLTDLYHPTQVLADLMTIEESLGSLGGKTLAYLGDGRNNVARSLLIGSAKMGLNAVIVSPASLAPDPELLERCRQLARGSRSDVATTDSLSDGLPGADVVYTDVWVSMGEEDQARDRIDLLRPFQVDRTLMELTGRPETIFLHCLPAVRGNEVSSEVLDGPQSRVWDQAENRKHTAKSVMLATLGVEGELS